MSQEEVHELLKRKHTLEACVSLWRNFVALLYVGGIVPQQRRRNAHVSTLFILILPRLRQSSVKLLSVADAQAVTLEILPDLHDESTLPKTPLIPVIASSIAVVPTRSIAKRPGEDEKVKIKCRRRNYGLTIPLREDAFNTARVRNLLETPDVRRI